MIPQKEILEQEGLMPAAQTTSQTGSSTDSGSDSYPKDTYADTKLQGVSVLSFARYDWVASKQLEELRRPDNACME